MKVTSHRSRAAPDPVEAARPALRAAPKRAPPPTRARSSVCSPDEVVGDYEVFVRVVLVRRSGSSRRGFTLGRRLGRERYNGVLVTLPDAGCGLLRNDGVMALITNDEDRSR